ncbi:MAG: hypothetical protein LBU89_08300 [Fibromonadaceae bacterium]|nr:hypothetical protein [Fibromonadaceae bacterium]
MNRTKPILAAAIFIALALTTTLQAQTPYTELSYPAIGGNTTSGTLLGSSINITDPMGNSYIGGKGYSFNMNAGQTYKITVRYTSGTYVNANPRLHLLTGGQLQGTYSDIIYSKGDWASGTEFSVIGYYAPNLIELVRILLSDSRGNGLGYTLTIQEVTPILYSELSYPALTSNTINGTLEDDVAIFRGSSIIYGTGKGYSINLEAGTYDFTVSTNSKDARLSLYLSESYEYYSFWEGRSSVNYTASGNETMYILLFDENGNNLDYTLNVRKVIPYTELNYTEVDGNGKGAGTLTTSVTHPRGWGTNILAQGHKFEAKAGKAYTVTVTYKTPQSDGRERCAGFFLLNSDMNVSGEDFRCSYSNEFTVGNYEPYSSSKDDMTYILLYSGDGEALEYTLSVEETISYAELEYTRINTIPTIALTGTFDTKVSLGDGYGTANAVGYIFKPEIGKTYKITATYTRATASKMNMNFFLLKNSLQGDFNSDVISNHWNESETSVTELTATGIYKSLTGEDVRILLMDHYSQTYSLSIEETENVTFYTELEYKTEVPTNGTEVKGSVDANEDAFMIVGFMATGKGYYF